MSRDWTLDDREIDDSGPRRGGGSGAVDGPERTDETWRSLARAGGAPEDASRFVVTRWHERLVTVSPDERATLRTLGSYRTVALTDLTRQVYDGQADRADRDVRRLIRHGWVEHRTPPGRTGGRAATVLTLTRDGAAFTRAHAVREGQTVQWGLVKPREQAHDTALYRMAMAETERLAKRGTVVRRVVLDAELKGQLAAARNRPGTETPEGRTKAAARALHLRVVDGTVQIPDLRLEVETRDGVHTRVDLELATEHYKPGQIAAKAEAGFTIYVAPGQAGRVTAALEDRGLVAEILSL